MRVRRRLVLAVAVTSLLLGRARWAVAHDHDHDCHDVAGYLGGSVPTAADGGGCRETSTSG
ncbi:hypothetical protein [Kitasatospora sp. CB01950]|uniref:hypothetical protein n=1 Tax=Kitasatospora sp. CB01950 TaxID=1703930 RepID=UPI00093D3881|nr:hypothetical protein [Kitasatospora sp. CB01950]OKJ05259.1 hypothetical protein AMK19_26080 [Kitasatospora sp. CB01950]